MSYPAGKVVSLDVFTNLLVFASPSYQRNSSESPILEGVRRTRAAARRADRGGGGQKLGQWLGRDIHTHAHAQNIIYFCFNNIVVEETGTVGSL